MGRERIASCDQQGDSGVRTDVRTPHVRAEDVRTEAGSADERVEFVTDPAELLEEFRTLADEQGALIFRLANALVTQLQAVGLAVDAAIAVVIAEFGVDVIDHSREVEENQADPVSSAKDEFTRAAKPTIAGRADAPELVRNALAAMERARGTSASSGGTTSR